MIDQVDEALQKWVKSVTGSAAAISLDAPVSGGTQTVSLYLLEIIDDPDRHTGDSRPYQPVLRYLVTTNAGEPQQAHRLLSDLLYAAMESSDYEVDLTPVPAHIWTGFSLAPKPAFFLRASLPEKALGKPGKPVFQSEPDLDSGVPIVPLYGLLLGPNDVPLMNARIELPNLFRFVYTDSKGGFVLQGVPAAPKEKTLLIKARKREKTIVVQQTGQPDQPVVIRFNLFENEGEN